MYVLFGLGLALFILCSLLGKLITCNIFFNVTFSRLYFNSRLALAGLRDQNQIYLRTFFAVLLIN